MAERFYSSGVLVLATFWMSHIEQNKKARATGVHMIKYLIICIWIVLLCFATLTFIHHLEQKQLVKRLYLEGAGAVTRNYGVGLGVDQHANSNMNKNESIQAQQHLQNLQNIRMHNTLRFTHKANSLAQTDTSSAN